MTTLLVDFLRDHGPLLIALRIDDCCTGGALDWAGVVEAD
jgi:hypothetical protein